MKFLELVKSLSFKSLEFIVKVLNLNWVINFFRAFIIGILNMTLSFYIKKTYYYFAKVI